MTGNADHQTPVHERRILTHPLSQLNIFKHDDAFAVFDDAGNITWDAPSPLGLFCRDTRILSHWRVMVEHAQLKLLNRDMDDLNVNMVSHLSCERFSDLSGKEIKDSTIYLRREKFLYKGTLYEKLTVENYTLEPVSLRLIVAFDADFMDIFQARGMERRQHGLGREVATGPDYVSIVYTGLDHQHRNCMIRFSREADVVTHARAEFLLELQHNMSETIYFAAGCDHGSVSGGLFDSMQGHIRALMERRAQGWVSIETGERRFDRWLERSRNGLLLLMTDYQTGPYPYAGIPWFCTPFGRDGLITAFQTLWAAPDISRGVLEFLAQYQAKDYSDFSDAEPGKILHEMREGEMSATGEVPFGRYYGSVDSTPLFVMLAGEYTAWTNDASLAEKLWPSIEAALEWMEREGDPDGDGFLAYKRKNDTGLSNQGWKDSDDSVLHADGSLLQPPIALCEVQGYAYAAWRAAADLARRLNKPGLERHYTQRAERLYARFNEKFWCEELGCYALALDAHYEPARIRSSNNGHLLWTGIVPEDRAEKVVDMLMSEDMLSGWGIRTLTTTAPRYNPMSYHNGSVWPHDTAIAAAGMGRYGYYREAEQVLSMLFQSAKHMRSLLLPQLFCGFGRKGAYGPAKYPAACILQAWACGAPFMALQGALGLTRDPEKGGFNIANPDFFLPVRITAQQ